MRAKPLTSTELPPGINRRYTAISKIAPYAALLFGLVPALPLFLLAAVLVPVSLWPFDPTQFAIAIAGVVGYVMAVYAVIQLFKRRLVTGNWVLSGLALGLLALVPLLQKLVAHSHWLGYLVFVSPFVCCALLLTTALIARNTSRS